MRQTVLICLLLGTAYLHAISGSCQSWPCGGICNGSAEVAGEALYLRPSRCDLEFAVLDPRPYVPPDPAPPQINSEEFGPIGEVQSVHPDYAWGFRAIIGFSRHQDCFDGRVIYTRLHTDDSKTIRPIPDVGSIWATGLIASDPNQPNGEPIFFQSLLFNPSEEDLLEIAAVATARARFQYDTGEAQLGTRCLTRCGGWLRGAVGGHFLYLDHEFSVAYEGTAHPGVLPPSPFQSRDVFGTVRRCTSAWGIGPKVVLEGRQCLYCGVGIQARFGAGLILGKRDAKYFQRYVAISTDPTDVMVLAARTWDTHSGHEDFIAPHFDARLGVHYLLCLGNGDSVLFEIGYEWITYVDTLPLGPNFRMDKGIASYDCASFTLDGPYAAVVVVF